MIEEDRLIGGENQSNEDLKTASVRPNSFADYIGQEDVKSQMSLFIKAAKSRSDVMLNHKCHYSSKLQNLVQMFLTIASFMGLLDLEKQP